jgi:hypothetical protein
MNRNGLTAAKLRAILITIMVMIIAISVGGFFFVQTRLSDYSDEVSYKVADAEASQDSVHLLQELQGELEKQKDVANKVASIVAPDQSHSYQDQIIQDLTVYASKTGVTISEFSFTQSGASSSTSQTPTGSSTANPNSISVTITLATPVVYENLIKFIDAIENNLARIQLTGIDLRQADSGNSNNISVDALTIEVYTR